MALSTYLNWDALQALNQEMSTFHYPRPDEIFSLVPPNQLVSYYSSDESFSLANTFFDSYIDPIIYPELYLSCTPQPYDYDPLISDILPPSQDYSLLPRSKRQRCCYDNQNHHQEQYSSLDLVPANFFDGFSPNACSLPREELLPELLFSAVPEFKVPALPSSGNFVGIIGDYEQCEKKCNEKTVSAQSIAARERRRKITEKTQELEKLIPNGNKMNTAEMLSAAAKYVKFLQAQVDMLQLMNTLEEEDKAATPNLDLNALLGSTSVQEKLYLEDKCFVPKEFLTTLTNDPHLQSKPSILKDLNQLIAKKIEKKDSRQKMHPA